MKSLDNRATVLILSCDKYSDVWDPFFTLFNKFWSDCPFRIVLCSETKSYPDKRVDSIAPYKQLDAKDLKKIQYGKRILDTLALIKSEYVIVLLDDFFLRKPVQTEEVFRLLDFMDSDEKIASINTNISYDLDDDKNSFSGYRLKPNYSDYKLDLQAGIWRKSVFEKYWFPYMLPWDFERYGSILTIDDGYKYYQRDFRTPPLFYYYDTEDFFRFGLRGGKWYINSVEKLFSENNIEVDFSIRGSVDETVKTRSILKSFIHTFGIKKIIKIIRILGLKWSLRWICWRIVSLSKKTNKEFLVWYREKAKTPIQQSN